MSRVIRYIRYDYGRGDEPREASLLLFLYDIPYFTSCGVLPSRFIINEILKVGANGGGMSPGATWEPFEITDEEFESLKKDIQAVPIDIIRASSRYADAPFIIDPSFDYLEDRATWSREVCQKYGAEWLRRVSPEIYGKMDDQALRNVVETMTNRRTDQTFQPRP
ncbi:hypothetical protein [Geomonas subterranea]|uniref:hypothetical protein n=1 Tax=Geomonas subterranea TaxID=2847989 RepID=UPI001CD2E53B|nr:hypothetical protein [Geomonas fuzhouensis]